MPVVTKSATSKPELSSLGQLPIRGLYCERGESLIAGAQIITIHVAIFPPNERKGPGSNLEHRKYYLRVTNR